MLPNGAALRVKAYSDGAFDVHAANFQLPAGLDGPLYSNSGNGKNGPQRVAMLASGLMDQLSFDPYGHVTGGATAILASPPSFDSILNQTRIRYDENGRWRLYDTLLQRQFPEYDEKGHLTRVKWQSPDKKELVERLRIGAATIGESQWQYRHDDRGNRIGIKAWLSAIAGAEFVLTDSFHGCVFSIIFNKPFFVLVNASRGASRFSSLLGSFGLEDRALQDPKDARLDATIDWDGVNEALRRKREDSMKFLKTSLGS